MEKKKIRLSIALATFNEEATLRECLASAKKIADEIVIADGRSSDRTREIAESFKAKVIVTDNPPVFHINKQKALDACRGDWILQLDADEKVSQELASEIRNVIGMSSKQIDERFIDPQKKRLFDRHQEEVEKRDGPVGKSEGEIVAFFVPRLNNFLGKYLRHAGTYPDGVIRLVKKGKAWFPAKSVHEQIAVDGRSAWLTHDLLHESNPTLKKYLSGADKYTNLLADSFRSQKVGINPYAALRYCVVKPAAHFVFLALWHKGILDGIHGLLFSLFSALHFPIAYWKYATTP